MATQDSVLANMILATTFGAATLSSGVTAATAVSWLKIGCLAVGGGIDVQVISIRNSICTLARSATLAPSMNCASVVHNGDCFQRSVEGRDGGFIGIRNASR